MIYQVKDWDKHFERAQTRPCRTMSWVAVPNRHDGTGYATIAEHPRKCELFTAWILILEVASKMPTRGLLFKDGKPITAKDLSKRTRYPEDIFTLAFAVLCQPEIDWLEQVEAGQLQDGSIDDTPCPLPDEEMPILEPETKKRTPTITALIAR
jgi:hypothetical protein